MRSLSTCQTFVRFGVTIAILTLTVSRPGGALKADTIYNVTAQDSDDFVPFENDGTPNRPNGSLMGNEITFGGTARYLDHVQVVFASIGPKEIDTYTLDLFKNDGAIDPNSGLPQPGTLIAQLTTQASNVPLPGNGGYGVDWNFNPILVPDTLTAIVSSSYSTTTPRQFMGPFAAVHPPLTGSALNTIWYGDGTPGDWTANNTWAINDGAATNYLDMRFDALQSVPEPSSLCLLALGTGGSLLLVLRRADLGNRLAPDGRHVAAAQRDGITIILRLPAMPGRRGNHDFLTAVECSLIMRSKAFGGEEIAIVPEPTAFAKPSVPDTTVNLY